MDQDAGGGSATDCGSRADGVRAHVPMCLLSSSTYLQCMPSHTAFPYLLLCAMCKDMLQAAAS